MKTEIFMTFHVVDTQRRDAGRSLHITYFFNLCTYQLSVHLQKNVVFPTNQNQSMRSVDQVRGALPPKLPPIGFANAHLHPQTANYYHDYLKAAEIQLKLRATTHPRTQSMFATRLVQFR